MDDKITIDWTPCTESQPTRPDKYMITFRPLIYRDQYDKPKVTVCSYYQEGRNLVWAKAKYGRVTAWAEMPKPYQEENNEL